MVFSTVSVMHTGSLYVFLESPFTSLINKYKFIYISFSESQSRGVRRVLHGRKLNPHYNGDGIMRIEATSSAKFKSAEPDAKQQLSKTRDLPYRGTAV